MRISHYLVVVAMAAACGGKVPGAPSVPGSDKLPDKPNVPGGLGDGVRDGAGLLLLRLRQGLAG